MNNTKSYILWTVVVPLLLLVMSVWQETRAVRCMEDARRYELRLAEAVPSLEALQARDPASLVRFTGDTVDKPVGEALRDIAHAREHMELLQKLCWVSIALATLGGLAALGVISAALTGLWGIRQVREAGMRSREALVRGFSLWRGRLSLVLCVLSGGLCWAIVCVVGFELWDYSIRPKHSGLDWELLARNFPLIFLIAAGVYVPYKIHQAWKKIFILNRRPMIGDLSTPQTHPALWDFVRDVASRADSPLPDGIILGVEPTFFVTAGEVDLYPQRGHATGKLLYLGLPFLAYLSREEVASIVAHELGHYAGEDLEYSRGFLPLYIGARRQLAVLVVDAEEDVLAISRVALEPARMLAECFLDSLDLTVKFWSRHRELAADAVSAAVVGPVTAAETLLRVYSLGEPLDEALQAWRESPDEDDYAPPDMRDTLGGPQGLLAFVRCAVREQGLADPRGALEEAAPHPLDTHPLTGQRLEAWGVEVDDALAARAMRLEESDLLWTWGILPEEACAPPLEERAEDSLPEGQSTSV